MAWRRLACGWQDVALWWVDLSMAPTDAGARWLSEEEHVRVARLRTPVLRQRWERARIALRGLLGAHCGLAPDALRFVLGAAGKPRLSHDRSCHFSLSHSEDVALVALCEVAEVGVDLEVLRPVPDAEVLLERVGSPRERADWAGVAGTEVASTAFLRAWTRKEACLKAVGVGLGVSPAQVDVGFGEEARQLLVPGEGGPVEVDLHSVAPTGAWVAALARCRT